MTAALGTVIIIIYYSTGALIMNRYAKISLAAAAAAGIYSALTGLAYYEVMGRKAHLPQAIFKADAKKAMKQPGYKPHQPNEDEIWFGEQTPVEFTRTNDENHALRAYYLPADKPSDIYAFLSHGYRSTAKGEFPRIAKFYHDEGINVFMIDHQAAGESEGGLITFGQREARDGLKWLDFMKETFGDDIKIILHGISMGCATVTAMTGAPTLPDNVKFTVADCGYTSMLDEFSHNLTLMKIPQFPLLNAVGVIHRAATGMSMKENAPIDAVKNARAPILFIHGANDDFVPTPMVYELYDACSSEKELLVVDGAKHAESFKINPDAYKAKVRDFIAKYTDNN